MDTSSIYITMCREAKELQLAHMTYEACDYYHEGPEEIYEHPNIKIISGATVGTARNIGNLVTWLPRQDQLQELIGDYIHQVEVMRQHFIRGTFSDILPGLSDDSIKSMEQLWLTLVMKEKYHKNWNGERWVK